MIKIKNLFSLALGLLLMSGSCQKESIIELEGCKLENSLKTVTDTKGTIWHDTQSDAYAIFVGIEGSYDSQDIGIVCNLPANFEVEGLKVLFSGNYYKCEEFTPLIPGQKYFYLELARIKLVKEK